MSRNHEQLAFRGIDTGSELELSVFMSRNYERDPDWFSEPEDQPDYGPPGMPTPWNPSDPRIADRQLSISNELRSLLNPARLPSTVDVHMVDMLQLNFDSFNTILGINNNDSYNVWKAHNRTMRQDERLSEIEDEAVLGVAGQEAITEFMMNTDGIQSAELWRLFHPFKYRMRHLEYRRHETEMMIQSAGGTVHDNTDGSRYFGLKLFPYVVETYRDLTPEENDKIAWLTNEVNKQKAILHGLANNMYQVRDSGMRSPEHGSVLDSISNSIDLYEKAIGEVHDLRQVHTTEGLLASIKRDVGVISKNDEHQIEVVERQLFAVDISSQKDLPAFQEAMHFVRTRCMEEPSAQNVYMNVAGHFMENSHLIIPVSTTAYEYEVPQAHHINRSYLGSLGAVGIGQSTRLRR